MRVGALTAFRLRGALSGRVLLAPLVALAALQLIGLAGGPEPAAVLMVTSACLAFPALAWIGRQVLDAEPDDQVLLSGLAVGGTVRETLAGLLAAYAVAAPLAVSYACGALLRDDDAAPGRVVLAGTALALVTALAAVAVGAFAARSVAGRGSASVIVLVAAPVLVAVLGLARSPLVTALVPRLVAAGRATNPPAGGLIKPNDWFLPRAPAILLQVLIWGVVALAVRLLLPQRQP